MSDLKNKIKSEMTQAMKDKNAARLQSIRLIWNAIRKKEIDDRKDLGDGDVEKLLQTILKQTTESYTQAKDAGRNEAVGELEAEISVLKEFLPEPLSDADLLNEVKKIVEELKAAGQLPEGPAAMGRVMKETMAKVGARADGKTVQTKVREALNL